ncbi:MAG: hypothetical protein MJ237_04180 [bacterium]|nr:hypothetical protein [bacterium]
MEIGIVTVIVIVIAFFVLKSVISFSLKVIGIALLIGIISLSIYICSQKPDMHKPFSMDTVEYLLKKNDDGSMTTTKQVTQTSYRKVQK